jgi:hypothetical protein
MGCCEAKPLQSTENPDIKLKQCIQSSNLSTLVQYTRFLKKKTPNFDINSIEIKVDDVLKVSPLGYSLLLGQVEIFKLIHDQLEGDFGLMEKNFAKYETSGLAIICLNNYITLLSVYFPLLIEHEETCIQISSSSMCYNEALTKSSIASIKSNTKSSFSSAQLACENGNLPVLNYFLNFKGRLPRSVQNEVDLNYVDPETGFNCAMIACKNNDLVMIKFLHTQAKSDFFIINRFGENVVNVLALGSKKLQGNVFKCLKYLIDVIGVDPLFNYQETLILLQDHTSLRYIEEILNTANIKFDRQKLIEESQINHSKRIETLQNRSINKFTFSTMFPELFSSSLLSSNRESQVSISKLINMTEANSKS